MDNSDKLFERILKKFFHDPIDKLLDIGEHERRAKEYAEILGIPLTGYDQNLYKFSDIIASAMERSILPKEVWGKSQGFTEIRHPLSEGKIPNNKIQVDLKSFSLKVSEMKEAYENLAELIKDKDNKTKLLIIYRNLLDKVHEKLKEHEFYELAKFIYILPADTRTPDHSLFEHLKVTSAINAFGIENYEGQDNSLFFFTIGGVQNFISQARKTQDLYMGSFIFSYLTFRAIEKVIEKYGPTSIIYPELYGQPLFDWYLESKNIPIKNPAEGSQNSPIYPTIPNKFVAILPTSDGIEILAEEIKDAITKEWENAVNKVLEDFGLNFGEIAKQKENQVADFPQIFWTAVPWKIGSEDLKLDDLKDFMDDGEFKKWEELQDFIKKHSILNIGLLYQPIYSTGEKFLGARKILREFQQNQSEALSKEKKCSLCGEREGVIRCAKKDGVIECMGKLRIGKFISQKEQLCIPCFTKRAFEKYLSAKNMPQFQDFSFPSTAEIASADFKEKVVDKAENEFSEYVRTFKEVIEQIGGKEKFQFMEPVLFVKPLPKLRSKFKEENLEGEWFYEENLTRKVFEEELGLENVSDEDIRKLREKLQKITEKAGKPNSYYAVLMLDGDNMGKWLAGELLPGIENAYNSEVWDSLPDDFKSKLKEVIPKKILTPNVHAAISSALRNYAIEFVRKIVEEEHLGVVVYSGGDDVLAFVNLRDLFPVMRKLRASFSGQIKFENSEIKVYWGNDSGFVDTGEKILLTMGKNATASCGVVIAHYKAPLKFVLDKAREMEEKAKEEGGRDAFAISLLKRSGGERVAVSKWRYGNLDVVEKLERIADAFDEKGGNAKISKGFIFKLMESLVRLKDGNGKLIVEPEMFYAELKRIISRSVSGENEQKRDLFNDMRGLFEEVEGVKMENRASNKPNIDNFINLIYIASFIKSREE